MKVLLLFFAMCIAGVTYGQDIRVAQGVPASVQKAFKSKFPAAKDVEWERKGERLEADFNVGRVDHKALYDQKGKLLAWKSDLRKGALPPAITRAIKTNYKGFRVDDADQVTRDGKVYYQVELDGTPDDLHVVFDKEGKVLEGADWW